MLIKSERFFMFFAPNRGNSVSNNGFAPLQANAHTFFSSSTIAVAVAVDRSFRFVFLLPRHIILFTTRFNRIG